MIRLSSQGYEIKMIHKGGLIKAEDVCLEASMNNFRMKIRSVQMT